jgi:hypothetical protein
MRIPSGNAAQAPSQSSVAQWQQRQQQVKALQTPVSPPPAPPKPTATGGHLLNVVA